MQAGEGLQSGLAVLRGLAGPGAGHFGLSGLGQHPPIEGHCSQLAFAERARRLTHPSQADELVAEGFD